MYLKGYYDDVEFTKYCIINSVTPSLTAKRDNSFFSNPNISGSNFNSTRFGQIVLDVDITIVNNVMVNLDNLNRIFTTSTPKPLKFSDRPDRYLMAIVDGDITFSSSYQASKAKIRFISPNYYWRSTEGYKEVNVVANSAIVNNLGTADTKPIFDIQFQSDCGFLSLISPSGFISLGNPTQPDRVELPSNETALDDSFASGALSSWTRVSNAQSYIPDYNQMTSQGTATTNYNGITINESTVGSGNSWNGHAYIKSLNQGQIEQEASSFELLSNVILSNTNGTSNTAAMLIVVMDTNNNPIMSTSIYDENSGKNELTVTFKIPERGNSKRSRIIYTGRLNTLSGNVFMKKNGARLEWQVYSDKTIRTTGSALRVGQQAHIKRSATHAETGHPILAGYHDKTYTIGAVKTGQDGTKAYRMDNGGWPIYWIYERDIIENLTTVVDRTPQVVRHSITDTQIGQMKASKVFIWQAKWGSTPKYSDFSINNMRVKRTYEGSSREVKNVFARGDRLYINNETGEVLLNGANATGLLDVDSRFFSVGGGKTQIELLYSNWARMPRTIVSYESRWLS